MKDSQSIEKTFSFSEALKLAKWQGYRFKRISSSFSFTVVKTTDVNGNEREVLYSLYNGEPYRVYGSIETTDILANDFVIIQ